jgi:hypothetical protein
MQVRIEQLVLPGSELEARPLEDSRSPVVVRVVNSYRHGSDFRYELVYYGLEPGQFDLRDYLRRKDGGSTTDLPPLRVEVKAVLPPGQIEPHRPEQRPAPRLGGYRLLAVLAAIAWWLGLVAILMAGRRRGAATTMASARPVTLAQRLRPLVERAVEGGLNQTELAELERVLLAYWRRRLGIDNLRPAEAIVALRRHPEAGELLRALESWLHRPARDAATDVSRLLKPYENIPDQVFA